MTPLFGNHCSKPSLDGGGAFYHFWNKGWLDQPWYTDAAKQVPSEEAVYQNSDLVSAYQLWRCCPSLAVSLHPEDAHRVVWLPHWYILLLQLKALVFQQYFSSVDFTAVSQALLYSSWSVSEVRRLLVILCFKGNKAFITSLLAGLDAFRWGGITQYVYSIYKYMLFWFWEKKQGTSEHLSQKFPGV